MLVDTHCHLTDERFDGEHDAVIARARLAGVRDVVVVADSVPTTDAGVAIAKRLGLWATAGVHPHHATDWSPDVADRIAERLGDPAVVAVGETGLDYHYDLSPRDAQRRAFEAQLELGARHALPVVVHARAADADVVDMLRGVRATVILHSFASGRTVFEAGVAAGAYVSFSGMVTFKNWDRDDVLKDCPASRLLVETDAPYLAPHPHRGRRNEPAYVRVVAERVAEVRGAPFAEIAALTTRNAERCFNLPTRPLPTAE